MSRQPIGNILKLVARSVPLEHVAHRLRFVLDYDHFLLFVKRVAEQQVGTEHIIALLHSALE